MKDKHEVIDIVTEYRPDTPDKIIVVKCGECDLVFQDMMDFLQERLLEQFALLGNKSSVAFAPNVEWVQQTTHRTAEELNLFQGIEKEV